MRPLMTQVSVCALLLLLPACCPQTDSAEKQNVALVRQVHEGVSRGDMTIFDQALSPDYVRHCQAMPPGQQELHGTDVFKGFIAEFMDAVPDCNDSINFIFAKSDMVAYVTTTTGTQTGPMGAFPPSGKPFSLTNIIIHRFENGKIVETWVSWDNLAMLSQLGFMPQPTSDEP